MSATQLPALTPEEALLETARFVSVHAGQCLDAPSSLGWLATGAVLMAQQAAVLALNAAGDTIPSQVGASELLLRAASKDRVAPPCTLPFTSSARRDFDLLVEARNNFMHPRAMAFHVTGRTLARGLPVAANVVRHLVLTQPVLPDLIAPGAQSDLRDCLAGLDALAEFLSD